MTEGTQTTRVREYSILFAAGNLLVLVLCALVWGYVSAGATAGTGTYSLGQFLGACVLALVIVNLAFLLFVRRLTGNREYALIGVILLLLGLFVNALYPSLGVPDEVGHFTATYGLSEQFYAATEADAVVDVMEVNYPTYGYLPAVLAVTVGRVLSVPYEALLVLGRMANDIAFLFLTYLSCKAAPDLSMAILTIAGLPSTIWLVASYSYDGWNLGFCMLFIAYLWRLTTRQDQRIGIREILVMVLLLLAFAPIKYIYVILGLLVFAIPGERWRNRKVIIGAVVACGIGGVIALRSRLAEVLELLFTSTTDIRGLSQGLSGEPYTISYVVHHPIPVLCTLIKTLYIEFEDMLDRMLVGEFGSSLVPGYLVVILGVLLVLLLLVSTRESLAGRAQTGRGTWIAWYYRGVLALGILAVYGSFLFLYSYYNKGRIDTISGVQGRYFLPLILLLAPAGPARLAVRCADWLENHRIRPVQILAALFYVAVLVLLCRTPEFVTG